MGNKTEEEEEDEGEEVKEANMIFFSESIIRRVLYH